MHDPFQVKSFSNYAFVSVNQQYIQQTISYVALINRDMKDESGEQHWIK